MVEARDPQRACNRASLCTTRPWSPAVGPARVPKRAVLGLWFARFGAFAGVADRRGFPAPGRRLWPALVARLPTLPCLGSVFRGCVAWCPLHRHWEIRRNPRNFPLLFE